MNSYHHGDLRNALILAAAELIEEQRSLDFTMAQAAKRAGVSAAAPYRHFRDRDELLQAVSELCYLGLSERAVATRDAHPVGSRASILALGQTYLDYVISHAAFHKVMWEDAGSALEARGVDERRPGFYTFVGAVSAWCERQGLGGNDPLDLAIKLWAIAHGLAVLKINGQLDHFHPQADVGAMLDSSANAFLDGVEKQT